MVEVIDLLTSPLKSSQLSVRRTAPKPMPREGDVFSLNSDDFDLTGLSGDLELPAPNPVKRRKLSPLVVVGARLTTSRVLRNSDPLNSDDFKFDFSDIDSPFRKPVKSGKAIETVQESDPISFSSSAPEVRPAKKKPEIICDISSDGLPENIFEGYVPSLSQPTAGPSSRVPFSEKTANPLATLNNDLSSAATKQATLCRTSSFRTKGASAVAASIVDEIFSSSPPKTQPVKGGKSRLTEAEKAARATDRAEARENAKLAKAADKEAEKERKRQEKEEKVREKQKADDIAEVNKKKTDKKVSSAEMIIDMSRALEETSTGNQIEEYMKNLEVETKYFEEEIDLSGPEGSEVLSFGNIIRWRRKVTAQYNDDLGHWEPLARSRIDHEEHIMIVLTALEFATIAAQPATPHTKTPINESAMKTNLDKHVKYIQSQSKVPNSKPIYLIEGLTAWLKKNKNAKNRAYQAAVLSHDPSASQSVSSSQAPRVRKRKAASSDSLDLSRIDETLAQSLQLHLQLHPSRPKIHLTNSPTTSAAWVKSFTEHISTIPYRSEKLSSNLNGASFCMESGQIRTGDGAQDTYVKMLQEVQRVTPGMAYGIAREWSCVRDLVGEFKKVGWGMLEDVQKGTNKDGGASDRRLGARVSRRLWGVFTGREEGSTEGVA